MTSNQTIDGVPRRVCHACVGLPRKAYCPVCDDDPAAQPQGEPVAVFEIDTTGYRCRVTLDPSKGLPPNGTKLYAQQPSPVSVVMRCSFCDVVNEHGSPWSGHSESVDGNLVYRVMGCKDHKHLVDEIKRQNTARQPRDEPVAWLIQCQHSGLVEQAEPNDKSDKPEDWSDSFPVYREPVAVYLPKRLVDSTGKLNQRGIGFMEGYNTCVDDLKRLNDINQ